MHAELQVLSPLVPIREINFLRFCKQLAEGAWAVADVSVDAIRENHSNPTANMKCRRLPSGCVVQDMPNGYCKVLTQNPRCIPIIYAVHTNALKKLNLITSK